MKVEIRINGSYHLELVPETPVEKLVVNEMLDRAGKGKTVKLTGMPTDDVNPLRAMDIAVEVG